MTAQELRDKGFVETSPGNWHRQDPVLGALHAHVQTYSKVVAPKRVRQSTKPLLNKLEQEWFDMICVQAAHLGLPKPYAQAIKFKIGNGVTYCPDIFHFDWPAIGEANRPTAFEVKGPWAPANGLAKVKVFASQYPGIRVILVWKENAVWQEQRIHSDTL